MVRLNKIYTRTGDAGETGLVDGSRVSKADPRMAAIGDVDEANSAIGVALLQRRRCGVAGDARRGSRTSCSISAPTSPRRARISRPSEMTLRIVQAQIDRLEREIDAMNEALEPLRSFILPGGGARRGRTSISPARSCGGPSGRRSRPAASVPLNPLALDLSQPPVRPSVRAARFAARRRGRRHSVAARRDPLSRR